MKVQENDYPGWPAQPKSQAIAQMHKKLDEVCKSADAARIARLWRLLHMADGPEARGARRFKGNYP